MPVLNSIAEMEAEMKGWRRYLHAHPELGLDCHGTAAFVAERLRDFGVDEIHEGVGRSGVVGLIRGRDAGPTIGLRADMDALPMTETTAAPHASTVAGRMHACGHDGHTTMLLGAAKYLAGTRNFAGTVALVFQPGEETGEGGPAMLADGLMDRFGITQIYALHTSPKHDLGCFVTRSGPFMAAVSDFDIRIRGRGGHGARPEETRDPVAAALTIGNALNTILARNTAANDQLVLSITQIHAGSAHNVIPAEAYIGGTIRSYRPEIQDLAKRRLREICEGCAAAMGVTVEIGGQIDLAPTVNDPKATRFAISVAREVSGADRVEGDYPPLMGSEDFGAMLAERPGAMLFLGQGVGPSVHETDFDFNDAAAPIGASYLARLVERALNGG
ncbi:M20 aminoacylase family protein [Defluviimonas sp. WL0075]|uniref:M20 family metallopeptidase n=1 Tax=Albidovulum sediminicola TaxID=2984331 RepID=A0ABT2YZI0_9RHOB|nr:M20 aminoacylase family protein [Defluviimonas sp. WL0075]MCV2864274.1 M20 family metallopeptidase [Defluviimonas sp. WL0075]